MPLEDVLAFLRARPFEPFLIHLDDGTTYMVRYSAQVLPTARSLSIGVALQPGQGWFDRVDRVALAHVTRLERHPGPTTGNGQA